MRRRILLSSVSGALLAMFATYSSPSLAQTAAALAGTVASTEEGPMEGVIVSAKRDNSNITVSVITDAQGKYTFPATKLGPGHYTLSMRAVGYDLDGPKTADVAAGATASADLKLKKTRNLSHQLTNAEWMMSVPGTDDQKLNLINCVSCHTVERIVKSTHNADEFVQVATRMAGYAQVSQPIKPQRRVDQARASNPEQFRKLADYFATINLSQSDTWSYPLVTMPRVKGRGTHVIITEYDLPRPTIEPHDVIVADGSVWYSNFGEEFLGRLNPATGETSEFPLPELKPGFPTGSLDLNPDKDGNLWLGMMYQAALAKFDPKTEKFQIFPVSPERNRNDTQLNMVTLRSDVDG
jgi:virginiamycin B lyase